MRVHDLTGEKCELEKQVVELRARAEQIERRSNEQKLSEEKKHAEEIQFLKRTNQQLKVIYIKRYSVTQSLLCTWAIHNL